MNIFILDKNMTKNAEYHCDKHVVKMITEYNQLLCSVYYFTKNIPDGIYKLTHQNHPCAKWTRESLSNWIWLRDMNLILCKEYTFRYNKTHKGELLCQSLIAPAIEDKGLTEFVQAIPEEYKSDNPVEAYRKYYNAEKRHIFSWKNREIPDWIKYF
mgnify:FL=1